MFFCHVANRQTAEQTSDTGQPISSEVIKPNLKKKAGDSNRGGESAAPLPLAL